jgi:hypothetical protein
MTKKGLRATADLQRFDQIIVAFNVRTDEMVVKEYHGIRGR